jgi:GNAT superfamily N-acetyltransferase
MGVICLIKIKKLHPDLIADYMAFHERLEFGHAPEWQGCYCHFYHSTEAQSHWTAETVKRHKLEVARNIENRVMTGFLAYDNDLLVGWLNANDINTYVRIKDSLQPYIQGRRLALAICYLVDPMYRNQGVARALLDAAIAHYRSEGYDGMLALPSRSKDNKERHYHGSLHMYEEKGFEHVESQGDVMVMFHAFH